MAKAKITEANIRDYFAAHFDLIESGLKLVDARIPPAQPAGRFGFLESSSRDAAGKLVIIEIKRTDAAAREAIQELYKYAPLLREKFLRQGHRFPLILLSVE